MRVPCKQSSDKFGKSFQFRDTQVADLRAAKVQLREIFDFRERASNRRR